MSARQRQMQLRAARAPKITRTVPSPGGSPPIPGGANDQPPADTRLPVELLRETMDKISEGIRSVGTRMDSFQQELTAVNGRVDAMGPEADTLISDTDEAREVSAEYVRNLEHQLAQLKSTGQKSQSVVSLPGVNEGKDKFFFTRFAYAAATGDWSRAGYELEVIEETKKRALSTTLDTAAGMLLPVQVLAEMIPLLRAKQVLVAVGATILDGLTAGEIQIPKQTGGATAYWVAPNTAPTESNLTVGMVTARPHTLAVHTIIERALAERAVPSIENMVRVDAARVWALAYDLKALTGTGESNTPLGVANWPGINTQSIGSISGKGDYDEFMDMYGAVEDANVDLTSPGWIFRPSDWRKVAKIKDTNGDYLLRRDPTGGLPTQFLGYPKNASNQLTAGDCFFGNWSDLVLAEWGNLSAEASMQAGDAFLKRQIYLLMFQDVDSILRHAESFNFCTDLAA